ncbi:MarR family winged helix-turn-helix transcriptional regulator [Peptoniphilus sp.]|jgi:DNA-binding MarR family transcriptional regulator|uniref:MarR family winged helix-turn-helix transcriptional regulator n=1 Tax=Peptoniphilus sp. TaxID=1971214 RepID=UPI003D8BD3C4
MKLDYHEEMKLKNQFCFPIYAASRQVTQLYTPLLKPLGLTYTQYLVFLVLWEEDGITVGEICNRLMLDNGTISPVLKKIETLGYIERRRSKNDDRVVIIYLTEKGKDLQEKAKDIPEKMLNCVNLPKDKAIELRSLLYELLDSTRNNK